MTTEDALQKAYESAFTFEKESHGCAQATVKAIIDLFDVDEVLFKAVSPCSGGLSNGGIGPCGGLISGSIILGYFFGRDINHIHISGRKFKDRALMNVLRKKYHDTYDGETCREVQKSVFGHSFNLMTEEGRRNFDAEGGHTTICPNVIGQAAKWVAEMLIDEGISLKGEYKIDR